MSNELYSVIHQSTLNEIILNKIKEFTPAVGGTVDGNELPANIVASMEEVAEEIVATVKELNKLFIEKGVTAVSAKDYALFLCSLLPEYIFAPTSTITKDEAEAAVIFQMTNTNILDMRSAIAARNFHSQTGEERMGYDLVLSQVNEIDDATIKDAYKTMLMNQLNEQIQPQL